MVDENQATELYRRYRPSKFSEVVGQDESVTVLSELGRRNAVPQFLLLTGPSGCGKTTLARILRKKLKCGDADYVEINAAKERGIDMVRDIERRMGFKPIGGPCRMWICDECHQLTVDAQGGFLKILEDTPPWVYFVFCTTDPQKLKSTIRTRATSINLKAVGRTDLKSLIHRVAEAELGVGFSDEVSDKIVDMSDGSPRKALVLLGQVLGIEDEEKQLSVLRDSDYQTEAIELCRALLNPRGGWSEIAKILKGIEGLDEQVESIRWMVLDYMASVAVGGSKQAQRAVDIINLFKTPFYDSKRAGLILACHDAVSQEN